MTDRTAPPSGPVAGETSESDDQLLEDGQEEVFSRAEVEAGRIEHSVKAGGDPGVAGQGAPKPGDR